MSVIRLGAAEIRSALEMSITGLPIAMVGAEPSLVETCRDWLAPHFLQEDDTWSLDFRMWVLRVDDEVMVIDPCTGNGRPHPLPMFDGLDTPFIERFCETGLRPAA